MTKVFAILLIFISCRAFAQVDPSVYSITTGGSATSSTSEPSTSSDLETGRYVKKPHARLKKTRKPAGDQVYTPPAPPVETTDLQNSQVKPLPALTADSFNNEAAPQPGAEEPQPSFGHKMRDMFLGGDLEQIDRYRSFLDSEDIRKNIFEFTLASSYFYNQSTSPYYFRNYLNSSPDAFVGVNIWLTPFLGIDADYRTAILNTIKDSPSQETYIDADHSWFDLGLKFRRFFGLNVNAPSLSVGVKYADYFLSVPPNSQYRLKQHTQGPALSLDMTVPAGRNYAWLFGLNVQPYLTQTELVTSNDLRSGDSNQTAGFGASLGGEYRFTRATRAFFKFSTMFYRSQFSGPAMAVDPVTGSTPTSVPVTNAFYMLDLGLVLGR